MHFIHLYQLELPNSLNVYLVLLSLGLNVSGSYLAYLCSDYLVL